MGSRRRPVPPPVSPVIPEAFLAGPTFGPVAGGAATELVVLLHGVGADGNDLIALAPHFAKHLPWAKFVSPHGPEAYDLMPPGLAFGRQWFSLRSFAPADMLKGADAARPIVDRFLDDLLAREGVMPGKLALVGFSQGAMMALHVGLRRDPPPAAIVSYSGVLLGMERLKAEIRGRPPVLLIHGADDPLVPPASLVAAERALAALSVPVTARLSPGLGHGIDEAGIAEGARFLAAHLG